MEYLDSGFTRPKARRMRWNVQDVGPLRKTADAGSVPTVIDYHTHP